MQRFAYRGFDKTGNRISGTLDAANLSDAQRQLVLRGIIVEQVYTAAAEVQNRPFTLFRGRDAVNARLFRDLAVLTAAGLPFERAVKAMSATSASTTQKLSLEALSNRLTAGVSASAAFSVVPGVGADLLTLIESAERTSNFAAVFLSIAEDIEFRLKYRRELFDALLYPIFLLAMMIVVLCILAFVLVPALMPIFEGGNRPPPLLLSLLSSGAAALSDPLAILSIAASLGLLFLWILRLRNAGRLLDITLSLPLIGQITRNIALAGYLRTLALLLQNAVPLTEALALAGNGCAIPAYKLILQSVNEQVSAGKRLHQVLDATTLFPPSVISLVAVGDEVNRLPITLQSASSMLREQSQRRIERLMSLLTPAITIVLGILVGGLVISVMSAMLSVNELSL